MRWSVVLALLVGCRFEHGTAVATSDAALDSAVDAPVDMALVKVCPTDAHLRLCYSFDADPLPASMPDEGAANVSAMLTDVTRVDHDGGGAAQLSTTSMIYVPYTSEVTGIQTLELMFRADAPPPANFARVGLLDSNIIPPNISLFWYRVDPGYQLRCGLGGALYSFDAPIQLGTWYRAVCTCNADTLQLFLDDVKLGEVASSQCSSGGAFVAAGLTIGSNNNGGPTGNDEWLVGAVDTVRLWDVYVAPPQQLIASEQ